MKKRLLLVEDELSLSKLIKLNLEIKGYDVTLATNGRKALQLMDEAYFDLVILDLMLPLLNGLDVLTAIRVTNSEIPVIITSAKDTSSDRIEGLKQGADDYLIKPFEIEELYLRIQKLLGRSAAISNNPLTIDTYAFGHNSINFKTYQGSHRGHTFELKQKEFLIMKFLINKKNEVVSRHDILRNVWGYDVFPSTRTIDNFITTLRKQFEDDPKNPKYIRSVRGIGYKFVDPPE